MRFIEFVAYHYVLSEPLFRFVFYRHVYKDYCGDRWNDDKLEDMQEWCEEMMPGRSMILCTGYTEASLCTFSYHNVCFKNKEDLMAFKLVWYDEHKN